MLLKAAWLGIHCLFPVFCRHDIFCATAFTVLHCSAATLEAALGWSCEIHLPCESLCAGNPGDLLGKRALKSPELKVGRRKSSGDCHGLSGVVLWHSCLVVISAWSSSTHWVQEEPPQGSEQLSSSWESSPGLGSNCRALE